MFNRLHILLIPLTVSACFVLLALLDKDHNSISYVVTLSVLPGYLIYFVPTTIVCFYLYYQHRSKNTRTGALVKSLVPGVILSFSSIMALGFLFRIILT